MNLTAEQRVAAYNSKWPPALLTFNHRIYGVWVIGNTYKNASKFYGQYPHKLLQRILTLFQDKHNVMHLFSGMINSADAITYDINKDLRPTICDDVRNLLAHKAEIADRDLVMCDPPYDKGDFEKYGVKPFNKAQVLRDLGAILKPGAVVTWLDTKKPMYSKNTWFLLGEIMVSVSTNHRYRGLCLFQKT